MLDPRERCCVAECLEHAAFETERLLHRNSMSAVGRRSRKQSAGHVVDTDCRNVSRPGSVIRSTTPSNIVTEVRLTPIPPDKVEQRSVSPEHLDVLDGHRVASSGHWRESDVEPSQTSTVHSPSDHTRHSSDSEPNSRSTTEHIRVESVQEAPTSRFIRKKQTGVEETPADPRSLSVLPAVEDAVQRERGTAAISAASATAKKTYCVNVSGAGVPAHRSKKNQPQTSHVNAVPVQGSPLAERKTKVRSFAHFIACRGIVQFIIGLGRYC